MSGDTTDEDVLTDERLQAEELPLRLTHPPKAKPETKFKGASAYAPFNVEIYDPTETLKYDDIEIDSLTLGYQLKDIIAAKLNESSRIRPAIYSPPKRLREALVLFFEGKQIDDSDVLVSLGITKKKNHIYYIVDLSKLKGIDNSEVLPSDSSETSSTVSSPPIVPSILQGRRERRPSPYTQSGQGGTKKRKTQKRKTRKRKTRKRKTKKR